MHVKFLYTPFSTVGPCWSITHSIMELDECVFCPRRELLLKDSSTSGSGQGCVTQIPTAVGGSFETLCHPPLSSSGTKRGGPSAVIHQFVIDCQWETFSRSLPTSDSSLLLLPNLRHSGTLPLVPITGHLTRNAPESWYSVEPCIVEKPRFSCYY